jgi:hypothetical protein
VVNFEQILSANGRMLDLSVRAFFDFDRNSILVSRCPRSETCWAKGNTVQVPSTLQGESLKRLLQGAAAGA